MRRVLVLQSGAWDDPLKSSDKACGDLALGLGSKTTRVW